MNLKETFQVVRKPMVAVRSQPSTEGQIAPLQHWWVGGLGRLRG